MAKRGKIPRRRRRRRRGKMPKKREEKRKKTAGLLSQKWKEGKAVQNPKAKGAMTARLCSPKKKRRRANILSGTMEEEEEEFLDGNNKTKEGEKEIVTEEAQKTPQLTNPKENMAEEILLLLPRLLSLPRLPKQVLSPRLQALPRKLGTKRRI